jgi:hypothetical protein
MASDTAPNLIPGQVGPRRIVEGRASVSTENANQRGEMIPTGSFEKKWDAELGIALEVPDREPAEQERDIHNLRVRDRADRGRLLRAVPIFGDDEPSLGCRQSVGRRLGLDAEASLLTLPHRSIEKVVRLLRHARRAGESGHEIVQSREFGIRQSRHSGFLVGRPEFLECSLAPGP